MPSVKPRVELLTHTPAPEALIYAAFRQCYHAGEAADLWAKLQKGEISKEKQTAFIEDTLASGHTSPIEHVSFTFALSGISRALTHQLVRHRIASFSQQSQRYVDAKNFAYILPPSIEKNGEAKKVFENCMDTIAKAYQELQAMLEASGHKSGAKEDARFVLPQATASAIVVTMNCRSLLNFFAQRCCTRAQWEIREVATQMLTLCQEALPAIFLHAGAACERLGFCPENEKFTCGRYPRLP